MIGIAFIIEVLELDLVEKGALDELLRAEPVVDDGPGAEILHTRLHRAALVAGRAVFGAEDREKLALVLDHHAGAELCGFDAAHRFVRPRPSRGQRLPDSLRKFQQAGSQPGNLCVRRLRE